MQAETRSVFLVSSGCRTNQDEIASIGRRLNASGFVLAQEAQNADIIIVNTCAVTGHAESKTRRLVKSIARKFPNADILVTGCMAQLDPHAFAEFPGVKWVVGNESKDDVISILETMDRGVIHSIPDGSRIIQTENVSLKRENDAGRTRFSVKIQEGCNSRCSYCIVPFLRGPSHSASFDGIIRTIEKAVADGYREIVLTGTHIGQYRDNETGAGIEKLIERIVSLEQNDFRLRLSSLNPADVTPGLCDFIASEKRICEHLHISIQSFSPEVLVKMGRSESDLERCLDSIVKLRKARPGLNIGIDLITGFPGETGQMFESSLLELDKWNLGYAHVFRFSVRPKTAAADMSLQVPETEKTRRSEILRNAVSRCRKKFVGSQTGVIHRILVEQTDPVAGLSSNYLKIDAGMSGAAKNDWLDVCLDSYDHSKNKCTGHPAAGRAALDE